MQFCVWRNGAQWCKDFMWHISVDKLWRYWTALDLTGRRNMVHTDGCADRWWFVHDFLGVGDLQGQTFTFSHGMAMYSVREDLPCKTNHVCRCISSNKIDHRLIVCSNATPMTATKRMHIASRDTKALRPKWVQTAKSVKNEIAEVRFVQQCLCVCVWVGE